MKVKDIGYSSVTWVNDDLPIKSLARMVFNTNLSSFPVVHKKKLVGFISEEDIFSRIFNSETGKFKNDSEVNILLEKPVKDLMVKDVVTVTEDEDLINAQILMRKHRFARLPVVNEKKELVGVITRGDVFKQVLKNQMEQMEQDQYASFISENYDNMVEWEKRFNYEFPTLFRVFDKRKVKKILDLGVWTGEYSIGLAKEGLEIIGLDHNPLMIAQANAKLEKLPEDVKKRVNFYLSDFKDIQKIVKSDVDAVICMGNSFPYLPNDLEQIISDAKKVLRKKDGVLIFQVLNMKKVLEKQRRLLSFHTEKAKIKGHENMHLEFFDVKENNTLAHNVMMFHSGGKVWTYEGMSSIPIKNITKDDIEKMLKRQGFKDISVTGNMGSYQGEYGQISLIKPYDERISDWMTVYAYT